MTFRSAGLCDLTGAYTNLNISATSLRTGWHLAIIIAVAGGTAILLALVRIRKILELSEARFREQLVENDRVFFELHDTLLQGFQGVVLRIEGATRMIGSAEPARRALETALDSADKVLVKCQNSVSHMRSVRNTPRRLLESFEEHISHLKLEKNIKAHVLVLEAPRLLMPLIQAEVITIGREALTYAWHRSNATVILLELSFGSTQFRMSCRDDGDDVHPDISAADISARHWNLISLQERAETIGAVFRITKAAPSGNLIEIEIPSRVAYIRSKRRSLLKVLQGVLGGSIAFETEVEFDWTSLDRKRQ